MTKSLQNLPVNLVKELDKLDETLGALRTLAKSVGVRSDGFNYTNALLALKKKLNDLKQFESQAEALGYSSLALALKALSQTKSEVQVPSWARFHPAHWVTETRVERHQHFKNSRLVDSTYKIPAVSSRVAQNRLKGLWPLIAEVLSYNDKESHESALRDFFQTSPYEEFEEALYDFLRDPLEPYEEISTSDEVTRLNAEVEHDLVII